MAKINQRSPNLLVADEVYNWETFTSNDGIRYDLARPLGWQGGLYGLKLRFKYAWGVFTGKYDALTWRQGQ